MEFATIGEQCKNSPLCVLCIPREGILSRDINTRAIQRPLCPPLCPPLVSASGISSVSRYDRCCESGPLFYSICPHREKYAFLGFYIRLELLCRIVRANPFSLLRVRENLSHSYLIHTFVIAADLN